MTCPIFTATSVAARAYAEATKLYEAIHDILQQSYATKETAECQIDDDQSWMIRTYGIEYALTGVVPRRRVPSQVALHFDLFRDVPNGEPWPHAREALLVVGYAPLLSQGWTLKKLAVSADGTLPEHKGCLRRELDGRLLVWGEDYGDAPWNQRDWIFGVPLALLDGIPALRREVTAPLLALLSGGEPGQAFAGTSALRWAQGS